MTGAFWFDNFIGVMKIVVAAFLFLFGITCLAEQGRPEQSGGAELAWWAHARTGLYFSTPDRDVNADVWKHQLERSYFLSVGLLRRFPMSNSWFYVLGGELSHGRSIEEASGSGTATIEVAKDHIALTGGIGLAPDSLGGRWGGYGFISYFPIGNQVTTIKAQGFQSELSSEESTGSYGAVFYFVALDHLRPTLTFEYVGSTLVTLGMIYGF